MLHRRRRGDGCEGKDLISGHSAALRAVTHSTAGDTARLREPLLASAASSGELTGGNRSRAAAALGAAAPSACGGGWAGLPSGFLGGSDGGGMVAHGTVLRGFQEKGTGCRKFPHYRRLVRGNWGGSDKME